MVFTGVGGRKHGNWFFCDIKYWQNTPLITFDTWSNCWIKTRLLLSFLFRRCEWVVAEIFPNLTSFSFDDACDFCCFRFDSFFAEFWLFWLRNVHFLASQKESSQEIWLRVESGQPKIGLTQVESSRVRTRKHHYCGERFQSFSLIYHFSPNSQVRRHFLFLKNIIKQVFSKGASKIELMEIYAHQCFYFPRMNCNYCRKSSGEYSKLNKLFPILFMTMASFSNMLYGSREFIVINFQDNPRPCFLHSYTFPNFIAVSLFGQILKMSLFMGSLCQNFLSCWFWKE